MRWFRSFGILIAVAGLCVSGAPPALAADPAGAAGLRPRTIADKRLAPAWDARLHQPDIIWVKFLDDQPVRLRDGRLSDLGTGVLAAAEPTLQRLTGAWSRESEVAEETLTQLRDTAQRNLRRATADLNTQFLYRLGAGEDIVATLRLLNAIAVVEIALPTPRPAPPPLPPSFQGQQTYLNPATAGVSATTTWSTFNVHGAGIRVADVEYSWNDAHIDLPDVTLIGPQPIDPDGFIDHGTAVLGEMASLSNGWGTTGIAPDATYYFSAANTAAGYNVAAAITRCLPVFDPGDVILIEQQTSGPAGPGTYVPVEWFLGTYNAIVTAVGNGIIVVEAAGNGSQDLDHPMFSQGAGGHWPFLEENDSGAIIVGAGAAPSPFGSTADRSRLGFSTYGSTVDLQGYGEAVATTGYGDLWSSGGVNQWYTGFFSGTSSASPMVAGACALLQSAHKEATGGSVLSPSELKDLLRQTGSPQQSGAFPASQNIGPRPDALAAISAVQDCNGNDIFDAIEISRGSGEDCNGNLMLDECEGEPVKVSSGPMSPLGGVTHVFAIPSPVSVVHDVYLTFEAVGDLGFSIESVQVLLNDAPLATVFGADGSDCPDSPDTAVIIVRAATWNAAVATGSVTIKLLPSSGVDAALCDGSFITVAAEYFDVESVDCDRDGMLDSCQIATVDHASDQLSPLGAGTSQSFTLTSPLLADSDVTLSFTAYGDLAFSSENVAVDVNGVSVGLLWAAFGEGHDCPTVPDSAALVVRASTWNAAAGTGEVTINMVPSAGVLATQCPAPTYITVAVSYTADSPSDLDGDGIIDACRKRSLPEDLNGDGDVDGADLALLLGAWGACPKRGAPGNCPADLDASGGVDGFDLAILLAAWS